MALPHAEACVMEFVRAHYCYQLTCHLGWDELIKQAANQLTCPLACAMSGEVGMFTQICKPHGEARVAQN